MNHSDAQGTSSPFGLQPPVATRPSTSVRALLRRAGGVLAMFVLTLLLFGDQVQPASRAIAALAELGHTGQMRVERTWFGRCGPDANRYDRRAVWTVHLTDSGGTLTLCTSWHRAPQVIRHG